MLVILSPALYSVSSATMVVGADLLFAECRCGFIFVPCNVGCSSLLSYISFFFFKVNLHECKSYLIHTELELGS